MTYSVLKSDRTVVGLRSARFIYTATPWRWTAC